LLALLSSAATAGAGESSPTVAIQIEGAQARSFRALIADLVPEGIEVADPGRFRLALARAGLPKGTMGYAVVNVRMRSKLVEIVQRAVKREKLAGAIVGRVKAGRRGAELMLLFIEEEGDPVVEEAVSLKGSRDDRSERIEQALAPAFESLAPEPEPEEPDVEPAEPIEEPEPAEPEAEPFDFQTHRYGSELFDLTLGLELDGRTFSYSDSPYNSANIRPYDAFPVPAVSLGAEIYPAATTGITVLSDVGLTISYMHAFGLSSQTSDAQYVFGTSWNRFTGGLRYRLRFGERDEHPLVLGVSGRLGLLSFSFDPDNPESEQIADEIATVSYTMLRLGADLRVPVGEVFSFTPSFGYDGPLSGGEVYDRFTGASLGGIDMGLAVAFELGGGFEIRSGIEYLRIFSSFAPEVGDAYVAGGALDEFVSLHALAAYVY